MCGWRRVRRICGTTAATPNTDGGVGDGQGEGVAGHRRVFLRRSLWIQSGTIQHHNARTEHRYAVRGGDLRHDQLRPTLDTVAAAAGVSRMTVSNAYNRPDQLSAATRERVLAVAAELGYGGPDPAGRSLRRGRAGTVGVLLTENLTYAVHRPGSGAVPARRSPTRSAAAGMAMLLLPADADRDGALVRSAIVDAFIVCSIWEDDPAVQAVRSRRLPFVSSGSPRLAGVAVRRDRQRRARPRSPPTTCSGSGTAASAIVGAPGGHGGRAGGHGRARAARVRAAGQRLRRACRRVQVEPATIAIVDATTNSTEAGIAAGRVLLPSPSADGASSP